MKFFERLFWIFLVAGIIWFAWSYIPPIRFATLSKGCATEEELKKVDSPHVSEEEKLKISRKFWDCIQSKQSPIERLVIKVPDKWKNN